MAAPKPKPKGNNQINAIKKAAELIKNKGRTGEIGTALSVKPKGKLSRRGK